MRFGRLSQKSRSWGRLSLRVLDRSTGDSLEPEEVSDSTDASFPPPLPTTDNLAEDPAMTSDPTQRLLTALGRFQRQFVKARNGAPQEHWSDECMNYLIQAVEIAVEQRWQDLVEALTETGRVLQTYENAGRANECVPFLADSYEILCLMVGDLIVDKVRSGVIRKWRERYQVALEDIAAKGLVLVRDEEDRRSAKAAAPQSQPQRAPSLRILEPEKPFSDADVEEIEMGEVPVVEEEVEEVAEDEEEELEDESEDEDTEETVEDATEESDSAPFELDDIDSLAEYAPEPIVEMPVDAPPAITNIQPAVAAAPAPDVAVVLDRLCDCLVRVEQEDESVIGPVFGRMHASLHDLRERADANNWAGAARACRAMERICNLAQNHPNARDDRFFELAYAFGGHYGDAMLPGGGDSILQNWLSECDDYLAFWSERPLEAAPAAPITAQTPPEIPFQEPEVELSIASDQEDDVPSMEDAWGADRVHEDDDHDVRLVTAAAEDDEPFESDDPATHLLDTARRAVKHGSIADAKLLAMQAAASIARAQASEAEARVRLAETRLQDGVRAIEAARAQVQQSEVRVAEAETAVSERRALLLDRGRHTQAMQSSLDGIESRIADIERRIRELEAQRDEGLRQRGAAMEALDEARTLEGAAKETLDTTLSSEQDARVKLEDARQSVKQLQRKQADNESTMERAREALNRQRASVADIEQTIEQIRNAEGATGTSGDDMLF
ncbi:MAG: hypothetical protein IT367_09420 [Candidatus Hydrogenedentes bacterium]|nr:hypothetical protein [Candidatus Hydrogenedentota bacterium]